MHGFEIAVLHRQDACRREEALHFVQRERKVGGVQDQYPVGDGQPRNADVGQRPAGDEDANMRRQLEQEIAPERQDRAIRQHFELIDEQGDRALVAVELFDEPVAALLMPRGGGTGLQVAECDLAAGIEDLREQFLQMRGMPCRVVVRFVQAEPAATDAARCALAADLLQCGGFAVPGRRLQDHDRLERGIEHAAQNVFAQDALTHHRRHQRGVAARIGARSSARGFIWQTARRIVRCWGRKAAELVHRPHTRSFNVFSWYGPYRSGAG